MTMQCMQLAHHVQATELCRSFLGSVWGKRAVLRARLRVSLVEECPANNSLNFAATGVRNKLACERRLVLSSRSERPRFETIVALAQSRPVEVEPLNEVSRKNIILIFFPL